MIVLTCTVKSCIVNGKSFFAVTIVASSRVVTHSIWTDRWEFDAFIYVYKEKKNNNKLMIDFNGMSTSLELFYVKRLGNCVHCTFIFAFFVELFLKSFYTQSCEIKCFNLIQILCTRLYDFKRSYLLQIIIWFQVIIST